MYMDETDGWIGNWPQNRTEIRIDMAPGRLEAGRYGRLEVCAAARRFICPLQKHLSCCRDFFRSPFFIANHGQGRKLAPINTAGN